MKSVLVVSLIMGVVAVGATRLAPGQASDVVVETPTVKAPSLVAVDGSGHGHDGVNQGSPAQGLQGRMGTSYSFDREGSWIQVMSHADLNPAERDFLVTAWVNLTGSPDDKQTFDIVRKGLSWTAGGEFKMEIIPGGRVQCSVKDARGRESSITAKDVFLPDGRWHRIGCARTPSTWSVLVDDSISSKPADLGSIGNTMPLAIGSKYGLQDGPRGRVDEVTLTVLEPSRTPPPRRQAAARIAQLLAAPSTAIWHLDEPPAG